MKRPTIQAVTWATDRVLDHRRPMGLAVRPHRELDQNTSLEADVKHLHQGPLVAVAERVVVTSDHLLHRKVGRLEEAKRPGRHFRSRRWLSHGDPGSRHRGRLLEGDASVKHPHRHRVVDSEHCHVGRARRGRDRMSDRGAPDPAKPGTVGLALRVDGAQYHACRHAIERRHADVAPRPRASDSPPTDTTRGPSSRWTTRRIGPTSTCPRLPFQREAGPGPRMESDHEPGTLRGVWSLTLREDHLLPLLPGQPGVDPEEQLASELGLPAPRPDVHVALCDRQQRCRAGPPPGLRASATRG